MSVYTTSTSGIFIGWETTSTLGTLFPGETSELFVKLAVSTSTVDVKYHLTNGSLPTGLSLNHDGTIFGAVAVNTGTSTSVTTSTFSITAKDNHQNHLITGTFSIIVSQTDPTEYTSMYFKPLQTKTKRLEYIQFVHNEDIFTKDLIYRPYDANFGIQQDLKLVLDFGVKKVSLSEYAGIISENFQKRRFLIGSLKSAVAKNPNKSIRHYLIYVDIIDTNIVNDTSISKSFTFNGITYYPSSITNIRERIKENTDRTDTLDPAFTKESQQVGYGKLGYIPFIPVCFATPEGASKIIRNIKNSDFKFRNIDYDIDRVYIADTQNNEGAKYLLLSRSTGLV
jgi:hypothetical protein